MAIAAIAILVLLLALLLYFFSAWLLYRIGKRLGYKRPWFAWIPIANLYMMVDLSKEDTVPWFLAILLTAFIPLLNIIGFVLLIIVCMDVAQRCGKERWWGILLIIPIVSWIVMYMLGSEPAAPPETPPDPYQGQYESLSRWR